MVIEPVWGLEVSEDGETAQLSVKLSAEPTADVTITVNADEQTEVSTDGGANYGSSADLTFAPGSATTEQMIMVRAIDDQVLEGTHTSKLSFTATSAYADYTVVPLVM